MVTASPAVREARRGVFADREARLIPDEEKVRRADFAYVNDGSLDELDAFVDGVVQGAHIVALRRIVLLVAVAVAAVGVVRVSAAHRAGLVGAHLVPAPLPGDRARARAALPA